MSLVDLFFTPIVAHENSNLSIEEVLVGQTFNHANEADTKVIPEVLNSLFGLQFRQKAATWWPSTSREDVTMDSSGASIPVVAHELSDAYGGDIDLCDPWISSLAGEAIASGELGELVLVVISNRFQRFTDGDRFFSLNDPDVRASSLLSLGINVNTATLADIINANTVGGVGPDAMLA